MEITYNYNPNKNGWSGIYCHLLLLSSELKITPIDKSPGNLERTFSGEKREIIYDSGGDVFFRGFDEDEASKIVAGINKRSPHLNLTRAT